MDNTYLPSQGSTTESVPNVPEQQLPAAGSTKSWKKPILIGFIVLVVLLLLGGLFFLKNSASQYNFQIGDQQITKEEFLPVYSYYKNNVGLGRDKALVFTKELFIENYVLTNAAKTKGKMTTKTTASQANATLPDPVKNLVNNNTALRAILLPTLGIQLRSGEYLVVFSDGKLTASEKKSLQQIALQRMIYYYKQSQAGITIAQIKKQFISDVVIKSQKKLQTNILYFTDMTRVHPIIPDKGFVATAFVTKPNHLSGVLNLGSTNQIALGMIYITSATGGNTTDYNSWLQQQEKTVKVSTNFSSLQ